MQKRPDIAKRTNARFAVSESILPEYDFDAVGGMEHVAALADRYAVYAKHTNNDVWCQIMAEYS